MIAVAICGLAAGLVLAADAPSSLKPVPPDRILWSWFVEDDLRFLKPDRVGVAYRLASLRLQGNTSVTAKPRRQPLRVAKGTFAMPVIRFDFSPKEQPAFSAAQRKLAAKMITELQAMTHSRSLQIDFDAPRSAHRFYGDLLRDLRNQLGPDVFLSVTALASWCATDQTWLSAMPVDEIVPMLFSMGPTTPAMVTLFRSDGDTLFPGCRDSVGLWTTDAAFSRPSRSKRVYLFADRSWSPVSVGAAVQAVKR